MVNFDKYIYNGWGLSKVALIKLKDIIKEHNLKNAIEFGSGQSTYFLNDIGINYTSFDDNKKYASKLDNVIIRNLIQLSDNEFYSIINGNVNYLDICKIYPVFNEIHSRQKNCFYKLESDDIYGKFDLVIIDGPHGNGRSIAFNLIKPFLCKTSFILVDDYNHYPFINHLKIAFPNAKLYYSQTERDDNFKIYKIEN